MNKIYPALVPVLSLPLTVSAHSGEHSGGGEPTVLLLLGIGLGVGAVAGFTFYLMRHRIGSAIVMGALAALLAGGTATAVLMPQGENIVFEQHPELQGVTMEVYKSPGCSCCESFIALLREQRMNVIVHEVSDSELKAFKEKRGVQPHQESCHTTLVNGYVVEGHMPFEVLAKLLREKPAIAGIALPGMPSGSPGMGTNKVEKFKIETLSGDEYLII